MVIKRVSSVAMAMAAVFCLSAPAAADGLPKSYLGVYAVYPTGTKVPPTAPTRIEIVSARPVQVKGGDYPVKLRLLAGRKWHDAHAKYNVRQRRLYGYAIVTGNGLRFQLKIAEVRPGYDISASYTHYQGSSAKQTGTTKYRYRRYRANRK